MGGASLVAPRLLRMCLLIRGLKNQVAPAYERGMYAGYRKIPRNIRENSVKPHYKGSVFVIRHSN